MPFNWSSVNALCASPSVLIAPLPAPEPLVPASTLVSYQVGHPPSFLAADELEDEFNLVEKSTVSRSKVELEALLLKALQDENYEEAAKLRDEMKAIEKMALK